MDSLLTYFNIGVLLPIGFIILAIAAGGEQNLWRRVIKIMLCVQLIFIFYGMTSTMLSDGNSNEFFHTWLQPIMATGITGIATWAYLDHHRFY